MQSFLASEGGRVSLSCVTLCLERRERMGKEEQRMGKKGGIKDRGGERIGAGGEKTKEVPTPPTKLSTTSAPRTQSPLYNVLRESSRHPPSMLLP